MGEQEGIQVSNQRIAEIMQLNQAKHINELMVEVAKLTAVNEALMGRLNEYIQRDHKAEAAIPDGKTQPGG